MKVEIRQIDAWSYEYGMWTWNDSVVIAYATFNDDATLEDQFAHWLTTHGISKSTLETEYYIAKDEDGILELRSKVSDKPIIAAII